MTQHQESDRCDLILENICGLQKLEETWYYRSFGSFTAPTSSDEEEKRDVDDDIEDHEDDVGRTFRCDLSKWYFHVGRVCDFQHETIAAAIACLDRFLALHPEVLLDRFVARLTGITVLYTVVKVHEVEALSLNQLIGLSSKQYTERDLKEMEIFILDALQWRIHPPTSIEFVRNLLLEENGIISTCLIQDAADRKLVMEVAVAQIQAALCDEYFIPMKPSMVAYGALMNAFKTVLPRRKDFNNNDLDDLRSILSIALGLQTQVGVNRKCHEIEDRLFKLAHVLVTMLTQRDEKEQQQQQKSESNDEESQGIDDCSTSLECGESPRSTVCR